jgi:hypothetical protein
MTTAQKQGTDFNIDTMSYPYCTGYEYTYNRDYLCKLCDTAAMVKVTLKSEGFDYFCSNHINKIKCLCSKCGIELARLTNFLGPKHCRTCVEKRVDAFNLVSENIEQIFANFQNKFKYWKKLKTPSEEDFAKISSFMKENPFAGKWFAVLNGYQKDVIDYPVILNIPQAEALSTLTNETSNFHVLFPCVKNIPGLIANRKCKGSDRLSYYNRVQSSEDMVFIWTDCRLTRIHGVMQVAECTICLENIKIDRKMDPMVITSFNTKWIFCNQCGVFTHIDCFRKLIESNPLYNQKCYTCGGNADLITVINREKYFHNR